MAQINNPVDAMVLNTLVNDFESPDFKERMMLPQNTYARVQIKTREQAYKLRERGAKILQTEMVTTDSAGNTHRKYLYWTLVSWEDIIRCAVIK